MTAAAATLRRITEQDAVGQLYRRDGAMAELGSEGVAVRLDWVDEVARLLDEPDRVQRVENEAGAIWARGVRQVIWAGMGGSVVTVQVLTGLGFGTGADGLTLHPLDGTDPAALNAVVRRLAADKGVVLPDRPAPPLIRTLLADTMMIAVSMGVTSEEPIGHLTWYLELLDQASLPPAEHVVVLTVDGSYLGRYAGRHALAVSAVHLAHRTGFPGRFSAPATRVFLLPVALHFAARPGGNGRLLAVLRQAWHQHDPAGAREAPQEHPYVRLGAILAAAGPAGRCRVLLDLPQPVRALRMWVEQLLEQSLGKAGKGVTVFGPQRLRPTAPGWYAGDVVRVRVDTHAAGPDRDGDHGRTELTVAEDRQVVLHHAALADPRDSHRLAALAAAMLGWQLCTALYGYLHGINIVDEPAVERYKAHARVLRSTVDPLRAAATGPWSGRVIRPGHRGATQSVAMLADVLCARLREPGGDQRPGYVDLTVNGQAPPADLAALRERMLALGNDVLGVAVKVRTAPAEYHVSEQNQMAGAGLLASIRVVARRHETCQLGRYPDTFLLAQAVASWQAMNEQGHWCFLVVLDDHRDYARESDAGLVGFLAELDRCVRARLASPDGR